MKRLTSWCVQLTACVLLLTAVATQAQDAEKADATGTWTWTAQGRNGGEAREITLKLKQEGEKVTGAMSGRQGNDTPITNGKITCDEVSFDVTREFQGNSMTQKYNGKIAGHTITGKISSERDGQAREREWVAKRKAEEKK